MRIRIRSSVWPTPRWGTARFRQCADGPAPYRVLCRLCILACLRQLGGSRRRPASIASQVRKLTGEDVMICLSVMPYAAGTWPSPRRHATAAPASSQSQTRTDSPIAALADEVLIAATANRHFFASQLGALYLLSRLSGSWLPSPETAFSLILKKQNYSHGIPGNISSGDKPPYSTKGGKPMMKRLWLPRLQVRLLWPRWRCRQTVTAARTRFGTR